LVDVNPQLFLVRTERARVVAVSNSELTRQYVGADQRQGGPVTGQG
jgi:hypothetical protein